MAAVLWFCGALLSAAVFIAVCAYFIIRFVTRDSSGSEPVAPATAETPSASSAPAEPVEPSAARISAWGRIALIAPFYGLAWVCSAAVALIVFGARDGWRDMRAMTDGEGK
ncbi:hypothetical protein VT84_09270 [Gemmata sp. SH-PL17]|uniref:hypothetical protein n=1 Tax=Gemmata sp. SH-PL17 TaxID=1630693 RepID=UPI00078EE469|nr:hypothetical protein [Gemmata sp. SH-PL17]AMV24573.1 hypothetical protein VT84_09270 [Gemmata sp. SH-PL17]